MNRETTHRRDPETGHYVQIVSPERLREILDADGENYEAPSGFGPDDEWDVADAEVTPDSAERTPDAWWAWHDADSSRWSPGESDEATADADRRCAAWVAGENSDGPETP